MRRPIFLFSEMFGIIQLWLKTIWKGPSKINSPNIIARTLFDFVSVLWQEEGFTWMRKFRQSEGTSQGKGYILLHIQS